MMLPFSISRFRLGIGDGARGQDQVAVELVGVGAGGGGLDERVAHPSGVRALAVKRALVDHAGLAVGVVVYHHRAVFDVLAGVHEVDAEHVEVALFAAEVLIHADTDHVAAECDDGVAQGCALADVDALVADVLGALLPLLHEGGGDVGVLAGDDFHAFGETGQTVVLDDDVGVGSSAVEMTRCRASRSSPLPITLTSTGWAISPDSSITVAVRPEFHSTAAARSLGLETVPETPSPRAHWLTATCFSSTAVPSA
mgnify:CR=1 FL=1